MAQTKTIQLLRSSQLYVPTSNPDKTALENAKAALSALTNRKDGEIVLARYQETDAEIKSVLGIYHTSPDLGNGQGTGGTDVTYTGGWTFIQDITSSSEGLTQLQAEIDRIETNVGLSTEGTYTGYSEDPVAGTSTTLKATVDNIISYIKGIDLTEVGGASGDVITAVSQADGKVSASKSSLTDVVMTGYAADSTKTGAIAATDTLEQAFNKVENAIAANEVASTDGTITVTHPTTGTNAGKTDLAVTIDGTTIVKSNVGVLKADLELTQLTSAELTALNNSNVKEAYKLIYHTDSNRTAIGDVVKIYKDSSLLSVALLHADLDAATPLKPTYSDGTWADIASASQTEENLALCFAYQLADGSTSVEAVPVGNFLRESEFGDGLTVSGGVVSVEIDSTSGRVRTAATPSGVTPGSADDSGLVDVLSVSSNGVKVDNIQAAIDYATTNLAVTAAGDSVYISAAQDANDNKKINVTGTYGSFNTPTAQSNTLSATTNGIAKAEDVATAVNAVISNLDGEATATAASGDVYTVLTSVTETDGVISKGGEVTLAAVAKTGAAADVSVTDTEGKLTSTNVEDALAEIVDKADASLNSVSSTNGVIAVGTKDANKNQALTFQVSASCAKQGDGATNMLTIANDGLVLSDTWDCGVF